MNNQASADRRARALRRAEERRAQVLDELAELDARYTRVAAAAARDAAKRSARAGRRAS